MPVWVLDIYGEFFCFLMLQLLNCSVMIMLKSQTSPTKPLFRSTKFILGAMFLIITAVSMNAQVFVINGGFEFSETIPNQTGQWDLIYNWTNAGSSSANPDYYHSFGYNGGDLPETPLAYVEAYNGYAIAGLEVSRRSGQNAREYLMGEFSEPLQVGKRYEFSFAIANGDVYKHSTAGLGVSDLGVIFSTDASEQQLREPILLHPHISLTQIHYYHGWKVVKFAFTASDKYEFFTFGLFGDDAGKEIESFEGPGRSIAYYFVDDFSIRDLTSELNNNISNDRGDMSNLFNLEISTFVPTAFTPNNDGLNDVFAPSLQPNRGALMRVFDRSGAMVWESDDEVPNWEGYTLDGGQAKLGVYVWTLSIVTEDGSVEELSGSVTLLQ